MTEVEGHVPGQYYVKKWNLIMIISTIATLLHFLGSLLLREGVGVGVGGRGGVGNIYGCHM